MEEGEAESLDVRDVDDEEPGEDVKTEREGSEGWGLDAAKVGASESEAGIEEVKLKPDAGAGESPALGPEAMDEGPRLDAGAVGERGI